MSEAHRYQAHVFDLVSRETSASACWRWAPASAHEPQPPRRRGARRRHRAEPACATRALAALGDHPALRASRLASLEECDRASLVAERFDTVACVNVLEHIEDDVSALRLFADIVAPREATF
jgi:hypothetical protein